jgi:hypothetical protein
MPDMMKAAESISAMITLRMIFPSIVAPFPSGYVDRWTSRLAAQHDGSCLLECGIRHSPVVD